MLSSGLHEIDGAGDGAPEWVGRADGTGVAAAALGAGIGSAVGIGTGDGTGPGVDAGTGLGVPVARHVAAISNSARIERGHVEGMPWWWVRVVWRAPGLENSPYERDCVAFNYFGPAHVSLGLF